MDLWKGGGLISCFGHTRKGWGWRRWDVVSGANHMKEKLNGSLMQMVCFLFPASAIMPRQKQFFGNFKEMFFLYFLLVLLEIQKGFEMGKKREWEMK